jgi:uncharacterized membrane protein
LAASIDRAHYRALHPLHAVLLASTVPLFLGVLLSDMAYSLSYEVQWTNFASWLIAGGLVFGGFALLWGLVELLRAGARRRGRSFLHFLVLLAMCGLGFVNALIHARDAWASMPTGLILSAAVALLAIAATWIGHSDTREGRSI